MNPPAKKSARKTWTRRETAPANMRLAHVVKTRRSQMGQGDLYWGNRPADTQAFMAAHSDVDTFIGDGTYRCIEAGVRKNYSRHTLASLDWILQFPEGTCFSVMEGGARPEDVLKFPMGSQDYTLEEALKGVRLAKAVTKKEAEARKEQAKAEQYNKELGLKELRITSQAAELISSLPSDESIERVLNQLWSTFGYE